jgi:hypothetical protein
LPLGLFLSYLGVIDMGIGRLISSYQPFAVHDLQVFEGGGVSCLPIGVEMFVDLTDGARTVLPEDAQNGQFGLGWRG